MTSQDTHKFAVKVMHDVGNLAELLFHYYQSSIHETNIHWCNKTKFCTWHIFDFMLMLFFSFSTFQILQFLNFTIFPILNFQLFKFDVQMLQFYHFSIFDFPFRFLNFTIFQISTFHIFNFSILIFHSNFDFQFYNFIFQFSSWIFNSSTF